MAQSGWETARGLLDSLIQIGNGFLVILRIRHREDGNLEGRFYSIDSPDCIPGGEVIGSIPINVNRAPATRHSAV